MVPDTDKSAESIELFRKYYELEKTKAVFQEHDDLYWEGIEHLYEAGLITEQQRGRLNWNRLHEP
eukprot:UN03843